MKVKLLFLLLGLVGLGICKATEGPNRHWAQRQHFTQGLPEDHAYQQILREYLASLDNNDYELELQPIQFELDFFNDPMILHRYWLLLGHKAKEAPRTSGLQIDGVNYLLDSIESEDGIMLRTGQRGTYRLPGIVAYPADTLWWALWDYQGNPYYMHPAIINRAFTAAAVDLIMLDWLQEQGAHGQRNVHRADYTGGALMWLGYVYNQMKEHEFVSPVVLDAYEQGLFRLVGRMTEWGPTRINDNMDLKALVGLGYIASVTTNFQLKALCEQYVDECLQVIHPIGIVYDTGGIEASYNGIALYYLAWAAQVNPWKGKIEDVVEQVIRFKSHNTLPEPDGKSYFGPSNFSTRTTPDMANDQYGRIHRDVALAMTSKEAAYLLSGGRTHRSEATLFPPNTSMLEQIKEGIDTLNKQLVPVNESFGQWEASWWPGSLNYAFDFYNTELLEEIKRWIDAEDPVIKAPFEREGVNFIERFPADSEMAGDDEGLFLITRFSGYGAIVESSPLSPQSPSIGRLGFSGGSLAAFWTPEGGSFILGRMGGWGNWYGVGGSTERMWQDWQLWPTHAVSGVTSDGNVFSSARLSSELLQPEVKVETSGAYYTVHGQIGARGKGVQHTDQGLQLDYSRSFNLDDAGVRIKTRLSGTELNQLSTCYEILPLFVCDSRAQPSGIPHQIIFNTADGRSIDPIPGEFYPDIKQVVVERASGKLAIEFDQRQRIALAAERFEDTHMSRAIVQNLLIDGMWNKEPDTETLEVAYLLQPLSAVSNAGTIRTETQD